MQIFQGGNWAVYKIKNSMHAIYEGISLGNYFFRPCIRNTESKLCIFKWIGWNSVLSLLNISVKLQLESENQ